MGIRLIPLVLVLAFACGVKAPPQPPGVPPARRGEPLRLCPGCELPAPDAYPSPSTEGDLSPSELEEEEPTAPEDAPPPPGEEGEPDASP